MSKITKLPLDSINVVGIADEGYLYYDRVHDEIIVSPSHNPNYIKATGDTLAGAIYYDYSVLPTNDNDLVQYAYLRQQIDLLLEEWDSFLHTTGGNMVGPILVGNTSDGLAIATKGQVDEIIDSEDFIHLTGGTMYKPVHLHSTDIMAYGDYHAIPKAVVDTYTENTIQAATVVFSNRYLMKAGGLMTGPLMLDDDVVPTLDGHAVTKSFLLKFVKDYVTNKDWTCTDEIEIIAANKPPVITRDPIVADLDRSFTPLIFNVLELTDDPDNDTVFLDSIVSPPSVGSAVIRPDFTIEYIPNTSMPRGTSATFTYRITDRIHTVDGTIIVNNPPNIDPTAEDVSTALSATSAAINPFKIPIVEP